MNKSRKARENSFRYQRVDLSREDSTDSEDDLDKILGPSTSPSMHNGVKYFKLAINLLIKRLPTILAPDILTRVILDGCFIFRYVQRSAMQTFHYMDVSTRKRFAMGTFWHGIFRYLNISAYGYFGTLQNNLDILAVTFQNLGY